MRGHAKALDIVGQVAESLERENSALKAKVAELEQENATLRQPAEPEKPKRAART